MSELLLSVPTLFGLESLTAREIRDLGYSAVTVEDGRVSFKGDENAICRCNLWLRTGERVQIKMGDFKAVTFNDLFEQTKSLPWHEILPLHANFPVTGHSLSSKLFSVPDCQAIIKKAIVDEMQKVYKLSRFPEDGNRYRVQFNIIRDRVTLYIDTTGEGLHKRGYREDSNIAPIKETLAAGMVLLSKWRSGIGLWDPMCGSGTIVIEAAMMMANVAPGLKRQFAAENWGNIDKTLWQRAREEAQASIKEPVWTEGQDGIILAGSDIEKKSIAIARSNAKKAGISKYTKFFQMAAKDIRPDHMRFPELGIRFPEKGVLICNPPYGERLNEVKEAEAIYREILPGFQQFGSWNWFIINSHESFETHFNKRADKKRKLYNGMIKCNLFQYWNSSKAPHKAVTKEL